MINKVFIMGYLGSDPELRTTQSGTSVATISVATTERFKDRDGNKQEKTEWHRVVLWDKQAEIADKYLTKGSGVHIEGKLQTRKWEDKQGNTKYQTEIVCLNLTFLPKTGAGRDDDRGRGRSEDRDEPRRDEPRGGGSEDRRGRDERGRDDDRSKTPSKGGGGKEETGKKPYDPDDDIPFLGCEPWEFTSRMI